VLERGHAASSIVEVVFVPFGLFGFGVYGVPFISRRGTQLRAHVPPSPQVRSVHPGGQVQASPANRSHHGSSGLRFGGWYGSLGVLVRTCGR
jgi:hypothetical protein